MSDLYDIVKTGSTTGTGSAINVSIGFIPRVVLIINETDGTAFIWSSSMDDGEMLEVITGAIAFEATAGISEYEGSATAQPGFTLGTDSELNTASDVLHYIAFR